MKELVSKLTELVTKFAELITNEWANE